MVEVGQVEEPQNVVLSKIPNMEIKGRKNIIHPMVSFKVKARDGSSNSKAKIIIQGIVCPHAFCTCKKICLDRLILTIMKLGDGNIFEEKSVVIFNGDGTEFVIGSQNHFQIASRVNIGQSIGNIEVSYYSFSSCSSFVLSKLLCMHSLCSFQVDTLHTRHTCFQYSL